MNASNVVDLPEPVHDVGWTGHGVVLLLFGALTAAWTWPLVRHLGDSLPGGPGDNYSFVWNLWWMRFALTHPDVHYFHTTYLFYPFGASLADHPHTALPAFVAATVFARLSLVSAQNALLLAYVFLNLSAAYALAWTATRHRIASTLAAIIFGLSPYLSVQLLGHFDLVAAWPLPLYALMLRRAIDRGSVPASIGAGILLAATAYIAYYYVVYMGVLSLVYVMARARIVRSVSHPGPASPGIVGARTMAAAAAGALAALASAIAITGGWIWSVGHLAIGMRSPHNILTAMWIAVAACAVTIWRPRLRLELRSPDAHRAFIVAAAVGAVFLALASPLAWQAARLVASGEYVTPAYQWRSAPRGVDILAPFVGHPLHPLFGAFARRAYLARHEDFVETIGWIGIVVPILLIATRRVWRAAGSDSRAWASVAVAFAIWALGPFLVVGGLDTGLDLPAILLRYIPLVANARMPGRAIVVVYLAISMLIAYGVAHARGRLQSPSIGLMVIALVAFEYWQAPVTLTPVAYPPIYASLAAAAPGAVCEVPFGIGDGLGGGGSQDRSVLLYATLHQHPLVGGFIGRMPADAAQRYAQIPVVSMLMALSSGTSSTLPRTQQPADASSSLCTYLVVHRSEASSKLLAYVDSLSPELLASAGDDRLYRTR